jgi:hypothetical protein
MRIYKVTFWGESKLPIAAATVECMTVMMAASMACELIETQVKDAYKILQAARSLTVTHTGDV